MAQINPKFAHFASHMHPFYATSSALNCSVLLSRRFTSQRLQTHARFALRIRPKYFRFIVQIRLKFARFTQ